MDPIADRGIKGAQVEQPSAPRRSRALRSARKPVKSRSPSPMDSDKDLNNDEASRNILKRQSVNDGSNSAGKQRRTSALTSERNTKESAEEASDMSDDQKSSDSDGEEEPAPTREELLKEKVVKMLREKLTARDFVRIRNELTQVQDRGNYHKITAIAPITALFMAECFLRPLPQEESNRQAE